MDRLTYALLFGIFLAIPTAQAQLKSRIDMLDEQYFQDRVKGLTLLNQKYIAQYEEKLASAAKEGKVEDVQAISKKISDLKTEIADLKGEIAEANQPENEQDVLVGNSVYFSHPSQNETIWVEFHENGKASFVGLGQIANDGWTWKRDFDGLIYFWDPEKISMKQGGALKLNDDGKSGSVKMSGKESDAELKSTKSRR